MPDPFFQDLKNLFGRSDAESIDYPDPSSGGEINPSDNVVGMAQSATEDAMMGDAPPRLLRRQAAAVAAIQSAWRPDWMDEVVAVGIRPKKVVLCEEHLVFDARCSGCSIVPENDVAGWSGRLLNTLAAFAKASVGLGLVVSGLLEEEVRMKMEEKGYTRNEVWTEVAVRDVAAAREKMEARRLEVTVGLGKDEVEDEVL